MAISATITGKEHGAIAVTTKLFSNILGFKIDPIRQTATITKADGNDEVIDISVATTLTGTISTTAFTIVIS